MDQPCRYFAAAAVDKLTCGAGLDGIGTAGTSSGVHHPRRGLAQHRINDPGGNALLPQINNLVGIQTIAVPGILDVGNDYAIVHLRLRELQNLRNSIGKRRRCRSLHDRKNGCLHRGFGICLDGRIARNLAPIPLGADAIIPAKAMPAAMLGRKFVFIKSPFNSTPHSRASCVNCQWFMKTA